MDKIKFPALHVPENFANQLGEFSSRTNPMSTRISLESHIPNSSFLKSFLYFLSHICIPLLWNLFVLLFISPILFICRYLAKTNLIFYQTFIVSDFLTFKIFCPLFISNYFWPNNKNRKYYFLILTIFEILTADEVWQINQIILKNKYKIHGCINFIIFRMVEIGCLSLDEAISSEKILRFVITDYDSDRMIKFLVCLVINQNPRFKLFQKLDIDEKNLKRIYRNKLETHIRKWTQLMSVDEIYRDFSGDTRQLLYEYKLGFFSWILFHRQMEGISHNKWRKICKEFDKEWLKSIKQTKELQDYTIDHEIRVVFINVSGGQGMQSVEQSFLQHFKSNLKMKFWYPIESIEEVLPIITCSRFTFKTLWEYGLRQKSPIINQFIIKCGPTFHSIFNKSKMKKFFNQKILKAVNKGKKPDLLVNFVPYLTTDLQMVASKFSIPIILYPTDMGFNGHDYFDSNDPKFFIRVPFIEFCYFDRCRFGLLNVRPGQFVFSGYAFKLNEKEFSSDIKELNSNNDDYSDPETLTEIAKNFDKNIITLTLGSHPSKRIQFFADELLKISDLRLHVIIITGKNEKLYNFLQMKYKSITINHMVSVSIIKYTNNFLRFLEISDIVLIKSGGGSMLECWNYAKPGRVFMIEPIYDVEKGNYLLSKDMKFSQTAYSPSAFAI